jgi:hypothetical protein
MVNAPCKDGRQLCVLSKLLSMLSNFASNPLIAKAGYSSVEGQIKNMLPATSAQHCMDRSSQRNLVASQQK